MLKIGDGSLRIEKKPGTLIPRIRYSILSKETIEFYISISKNPEIFGDSSIVSSKILK